MPEQVPQVPRLLAEHGLPRSEALALLGKASGRSREQLIADSGAPLATSCVAVFESLAMRRAAGEPMAYLVGQREFYCRRFDVDSSVLIPRPETELLVDAALAFIDRLAVPLSPYRVLDLGTGSGAIAITLKLERPDIAVVATDASDAALNVARANARRLGAEVRWAQGDWYDALSADEPPFDLIVANPPYIASDDGHLRAGDLRFEPRTALTDGANGLQALAAIVAGARIHLGETGSIAVEHGYNQAAAVRTLFIANGLEACACRHDLAGIARVSSATHRARIASR